MRVIFLSEKPCALHVNGLHLGVVNGFERSCELDPKDRVFCELKPSGDLPVSFFFDEAFLLDPPPQIRLYYFGGGVAVYAGEFLRADPTLRVVWQKKLGNDLLTLCVQGKLQLNLENETGFHLIPLPDSLQNAEACRMGKNILLEGEESFALLSHDGKVLVLSEGRVMERGEILRAEVPFRDSLGHTALCSWENGTLVDCAIRTPQEPTEATFALALFESALIGANTSPYLHETLRGKADSLKEYLGDFVSVVLTNERNKIGLVYPRKERIFDVRYYRVEITEGKVSNISTV